jgi:hypothetical protein
LVISAPKGKCYTLIGDELGEDGKIKSPIRLDWESGAAFTTPLGMWHSHHNESEEEDAWILPVQDAGLSLHQVKFRCFFFFDYLNLKKKKFFFFRDYMIFDLLMTNGNI